MMILNKRELRKTAKKFPAYIQLDSKYRLHMTVAELYDEILACKIYRYTSYQNDYALVAVHFLDFVNREWLNYFYDDNSFSNSSIEYVLSDRCKHDLLGMMTCDEKSIELLKEYTGFVGNSNEAYTIISSWESNILQIRLQTKYDNVLIKFEEFNKQVPAVPEEFNEWALKDVIPHYALFDNSKKEFVCTCCKQTHPYSNARKHKRGDLVKCPSCNRDIKCLPITRYAYEDIEAVSFAQPCDYGMVVRYFEVGHTSHTYSGHKFEDLYLTEYRRDFISEQGAWGENGICYIYGKYKLSSRYSFIPFEFRKMVYSWGNLTPSNSYMPKSIFYKKSAEYLKDTPFYYKVSPTLFDNIDFEELINSHPGSYFWTTMLHPMFETMVKFDNVDLMNGIERQKINFYYNEKDYWKALGLPKDICKALVFPRKIISNDELKILQEYYKSTGKLSVSVTGFIIDNEINSRDAIMVFKYGNENKTIKYLNDNIPNNPYMISDYIDYIRQLELGGIEINEYSLYPQNFAAVHTATNRRVKQKSKEQDIKAYLEMKETLETMYPTYSNDKYLIKIPDSADEFYQESDKLNHCVATCYLPKVIKGETVIMFIRNVANPSIPFVTIELKNEKIIQCRGKNNISAKPQVLKFANDYLLYLATSQVQTA